MNEKMVSWDSIQKWMPIVASAVTIAFTFANLDRRMALVEQKIDGLIVSVEKMTQKYSDVETRYGNLSVRVSILETKLNK